MPFRGHVSGGMIVLDDPISLPEGTPVIIKTQNINNVDTSGVGGSWVDDRSADDIIKDIRKARRSKK